MTDFPRGLYAFTDFQSLTSQAGRAQLATAVAVTGMSGLSINLYWDDVEPQNGVYDFSLLDSIMAALPAGTNIAMGLAAGQHSPAWLTDPEDAGCPFVKLRLTPHAGEKASDGTMVKVPAAYAQPYADHYVALHQALADHAAAAGYLGQIAIVKVGCVHGLDLEMELQSFLADTEQKTRYDAQWASAVPPYTQAAMIEAHTGMVAGIAGLFPDAALSVSMFIQGICFPWIDAGGSVVEDGRAESAAVVTGIVGALGDGYGTRAGIGGTCLGPETAPNFTIDLAKSKGVTLWWQTTILGGDDPTHKLAATLKNGVSTGATYIEVHIDDVLGCPEVIGSMGASLAG